MSFRILCADECVTIQTGVDRVARDCQCPIDKFVSTIEELQAAIQQEHFDVLITDLRLGSVNMIEFVADTKTNLPDLKEFCTPRFRTYLSSPKRSRINSTTLSLNQDP